MKAELHHYVLIFMIMLAFPLLLLEGDMIITINFGSINLFEIKLSLYITILGSSLIGLATISSLALNSEGPSIFMKVSTYIAVWITLSEIIEESMTFIQSIWNPIYLVLTVIYAIGLILNVSGNSGDE